MSFLKCIQDKIDSKLIAPREAKSLQKKFETLKKRFTNTMGDEDAAGQAALNIIQVEAQRLAQKKRNQIQHTLAQERILGELAKKPGKFDAKVRDFLQDVQRRGETV